LLLVEVVAVAVVAVAVGQVGIEQAQGFLLPQVQLTQLQ
jgi:hypothetical protein